MADPGHVKHNPATNEVAIRTAFDETQFPGMVWLVSSISMGARNARQDEVDAWADMYTPPPPPTPDPSVGPPADSSKTSSSPVASGNKP